MAKSATVDEPPTFDLVRAGNRVTGAMRSQSCGVESCSAAKSREGAAIESTMLLMINWLCDDNAEKGV